MSEVASCLVACSEYREYCPDPDASSADAPDAPTKSYSRIITSRESVPPPFFDGEIDWVSFDGAFYQVCLVAEFFLRVLVSLADTGRRKNNLTRRLCSDDLTSSAIRVRLADRTTIGPLRLRTIEFVCRSTRSPRDHATSRLRVTTKDGDGLVR